MRLFCAGLLIATGKQHYVHNCTNLAVWVLLNDEPIWVRLHSNTIFAVPWRNRIQSK
jgi:hypothetical protein